MHKGICRWNNRWTQRLLCNGFKSEVFSVNLFYFGTGKYSPVTFHLEYLSLLWLSVTTKLLSSTRWDAIHHMWIFVLLTVHCLFSPLQYTNQLRPHLFRVCGVWFTCWCVPIFHGRNVWQLWWLCLHNVLGPWRRMISRPTSQTCLACSWKHWILEPSTIRK